MTHVGQGSSGNQNMQQAARRKERIENAKLYHMP